MNLEQIKPWNWFKKEEPKSASTQMSDSPFNSMLNLRQEIDNFFNSSFGSSDFPSAFGGFSDEFSKLQKSVLKPKVDISETAEQYHISVEVPGIEEKDISLQLDSDGVLTIQGEKTFKDKKEDGKEWHSIECSYGSFQRVLALPEDADREKVAASFKNGVLSIDVARTASSGSDNVRRIDIKQG